jgi:hypothetical protein
MIIACCATGTFCCSPPIMLPDHQDRGVAVEVRNHREVMQRLEQQLTIKLVISGHVHQEFLVAQNGICYLSTPATGYQSTARFGRVTGVKRLVIAGSTCIPTVGLTAMSGVSRSWHPERDHPANSVLIGDRAAAVHVHHLAGHVGGIKQVTHRGASSRARALVSTTRPALVAQLIA